jgi:hypothetical protein
MGVPRSGACAGHHTPSESANTPGAICLGCLSETCKFRVSANQIKLALMRVTTVWFVLKAQTCGELHADVQTLRRVREDTSTPHP